MIRIRQVLPFALGFAFAVPAPAQEDGGTWLRLTANQRLSAVRNADLLPGGSDSSWRADTALGLTLSSRTRTETLVFGLNGSLRHVEATNPQDDVSFGLKSPSVSLRYSRSAATSRFQAGVRASTEEISYLRSRLVLEPIFLDTAGDPDTPDTPETEAPIAPVDPDAVLVSVLQDPDSGRRQVVAADTALTLGIGGPAQLSFSASTQDTRYIDTSGTGYRDSRAHSASAGMALHLSPVLRLNGRLGYRLFEQDGDSPRDTLSLSLGLNRPMPDGSMGASLSLTQIEEGTRSRIGVNWSQRTDNKRLSLDLGLSRSAAGEYGLSGGAAWAVTLPRTTLGASLNTGFGADDDDRETRFASLSTQLSHALGPMTDLSLNLSAAQSQATGGGGESLQWSAGASVSHRLNRDWAVNLGITHTSLRENSAAWAQSQSVFVSVGRSLSIRF